ncbi:reverse transcriptase domain-containing protein [Clostridium sp. FP1]|uniref:reverse transcriptase domain-containing protein n=1 Tax=Clostridium sp. FP1 TaxID=2724076 RepID=UPI00192DC4AB|nr:reverse transcriptase domain-containing protein [Clostridium sp. FP1]MBZ9636455.1 hypothetical protein [Clostridium sp. FP1]
MLTLDLSVGRGANVENLVKQMKSGSYKPEPIRRVYIPKDGSDKMRPFGISCYEDKLVENNISQILTMIYEPKFFNESFGFRPNRNCHQAAKEIIENVQYHKVSKAPLKEMGLHRFLQIYIFALRTGLLVSC